MRRSMSDHRQLPCPAGCAAPRPRVAYAPLYLDRVARIIGARPPRTAARLLSVIMLPQGGGQWVAFVRRDGDEFAEHRGTLYEVAQIAATLE